MTLRARLVVAIAVVVLVLVIIGILIPRAVRASLIDQVDAQLVAASRSVPGPRFANGAPPPIGQIPARPTTRFSELYIARIDAGSRNVLVSPAAVGRRQPKVPSRSSTSGARIRPETVGSLRGAGSWRAVMIHDASGSRALIALPLDRVDATSHRMTIAVLVAGGVALVVLIAAGWWLLRLGLRPIAEVTAVADAITRGDRTRRVLDDGSNTEAAHLARAFNVMLDEEQAQELRLRQFIADASHELRTPVAAMGGFADLWREGGIDEAEVGDVMRRIGQESVRMRGLVEDLMLLARLDEGRPLEQEQVDLGALAADAALDASATHPSRAVEVQVPEVPIAVVGDEARLRQVFANLVTNALVHTSPSCHVSVRVDCHDDRAVVAVADDGEGMTNEEAAHAFDRFWRADAARPRTGTGLGLAIVRSVVDAHGGDARIETVPGRGTVVRITLPLSGGETVDSHTARPRPAETRT